MPAPVGPTTASERWPSPPQPDSIADDAADAGAHELAQRRLGLERAQVAPGGLDDGPGDLRRDAGAVELVEQRDASSEDGPAGGSPRRAAGAEVHAGVGALALDHDRLAHPASTTGSSSTGPIEPAKSGSSISSIGAE